MQEWMQAHPHNDSRRRVSRRICYVACAAATAVTAGALLVATLRLATCHARPFPADILYAQQQKQQQQQQQQQQQRARYDNYDEADSNFQQKYFSQATTLCGRGDGSWQARYARSHADMLVGASSSVDKVDNKSRFFVSVAVEAGVADRLSGMITQFYLAILGNRAFTAITYGDLPSFEAACESPYGVDWMGNYFSGDHNRSLPEQVLAPLKYTYKGERGYTGDRSYDPAKVDTNKYAQLYTINTVPEDEWRTRNLSLIPKERPETPFVIGGSNRGRIYAIASQNPFHKQQFWRMGVRPENAFMCGLFFLCMPNEVVRRLYANKYWDVLVKDARALKIGINVRVGDAVFYGGGGDEEAAGLDVENNATARRELIGRYAADRYFECARKIEEKFQTSRHQPVIWYLMSDSLALRRAARFEYGAKVLTDLETKPVHPDCRHHNPDACGRHQVDLAMVHGMGQLFTISMTDYHVVPKESGFGRLGAWMSGKWGGLYELGGGEDGDDGSSLSCDVDRPTTPKESAEAWAGV